MECSLSSYERLPGTLAEAVQAAKTWVRAHWGALMERPLSADALRAVWRFQPGEIRGGVVAANGVVALSVFNDDASRECPILELRWIDRRDGLCTCGAAKKFNLFMNAWPKSCQDCAAAAPRGPAISRVPVGG